MSRAWLFWILVLSCGRSTMAADEPPTWFFQSRPLQVAADDNLSVLRDTGLGVDLMEIANQKIQEMEQDKSSNLVWRLGLGDLNVHPMLKIPPYEGQAGGVIMPRLLAAELRKVLPDLKSESVYTADDEPRVMLGTVTAKFKDVPGVVGIASVTDTLCARDHVCMQSLPPVDSDLVRFAPTTPGLSPFEMAEKLRSHGAIEWAEPDFALKVELFAARYPNDPHMGKQWYLRRIHAPEAWASSAGTARITIAVIDDGMDISHPDLRDKIVDGYDFVLDRPIRAGEAQPDEQKGMHGTAVAGIAAATTNNGAGIAGVAWYARIMPIRALGGPKDADLSPRLTRAILWAHDHGARIINVSWGKNRSDQLAYAIRKVTEAGSLVFCASGNDGPGLVAFPARLDDCIAVGAVDQQNKRWPYSSYGPKEKAVDIMAPSGLPGHKGDIWTTDSAGMLGYARAGDPQHLDASGDYDATFGGTSAAAPVVAGAAALVWSEFPLLNAEKVRELLERNAVSEAPEIGRTEQYGAGRLDLEAFMNAAKTHWHRLLAQSSSFKALVRLDRAYWPRAQSWKTPTGERQLAPANDNLVVILPTGQAPHWDLLLGPGFAPPAAPTFKIDTTEGFVIPRNQLVAERTLKDLAETSRLPTVYASYHENGAVFYPSSVVRITPVSDDARSAIYKYRDENVLDVLNDSGDAIRLGVSSQSVPVDVFQVVEELNAQNLGWAEPELVVAPAPAAVPTP